MTKKFHMNSIRSLKHGCAIDGKQTPEYFAWMSMKSRCLNPKNPKFPIYGGAGIRVCDSWLNFINFLSDVGVRPSEFHSLDRIDGSRGYEPGNVRWATSLEQNRNRSNARDVLVNGTKVSLMELSAMTGILYSTLCKRWNSGVRGYDEITKAIDKRKSRLGDLVGQ